MADTIPELYANMPRDCEPRFLVLFDDQFLVIAVENAAHIARTSTRAAGT
jgi:hypothetical protein